MRQYKPTPFLYTRTANTDNHEANSNYEDSNLLDLEVEVLKQRIDGNIKRHMDIRSEIRMEVDKLRQENMDLAAMLHRTDEIFYLHQDFFEEVNRLRSMNVRLKAMMCLQDVKSIEAFGPTKSRRGYQSNVQQPTNPNCPASSHSTERDTRAETSDKSSDLFDRIDKLEAEMRTFLGETPSHKKIEICQRKHVTDIDMQCSADRITRNIRDHSLDDNLIFIRRRDTKSDQTNGCDASTSTEMQLEAENYGHVDEPRTRSTFWTKDRDLHSHETYTSMTILRSKAESASSDDRDVNMNSSRSDDRSILLNNSNAITKSCSRSQDENVISEDRDINMNSHRSNDEWVLPDHTIINSSNNSECLLLMVHPKRSQSGTIVGFEVAENFEGTSIDKDKPVQHEVKRTHCEPTQPVFQKGVTSDLVPSYVDIPVSIEDLEIRDIFKNASNESDSDHSTTSSERPLKLSTPFTVVSTRHVRPRDVPRLNLGDLVSESDINIVRVTQDTVDDLLYDEEDRYSIVSFIDISDGSGRQRLGKEDMSVTDLQINQFGRYYNEESHFINDVTNVTGESCFMDDHHTRSDNPKNFSNRRSNLSNMIKKLCANKEMSYMQEFFSDVSADNKTVCPEADVRTSESIREESTQTIIGENTTWNNTFNGNSKLSAPTFQTELEEETPWVNLNDVNRSSVDISEDSVSVIPTDSDEDRYVHYMELCNTTMHLTGIIQDMCANRTSLTQQEFLQHTNPTEKPCPPEIWDGKDYVIENNIMRIPVKSESTNPHAKPDCLTKHCLTGLSSPSYTDIVKLVKENFPWTFPRAEEKNNNGIKESEDKECVKDYNSTLNVTIPCCTMDSVRSDVSCIDLSCEEETPNLGSTRKEPDVRLALSAANLQQMVWRNVLQTDQTFRVIPYTLIDT
ncbi:uncharacterized protein LOC117337658 isoform X1 [Pecten maximus]|uniref:uncharacterized protein LOC117337658 isoform X1 n=1 Tax=Pecten maximus TaxID=6579 RepID=UPI001458FB9E|nr:uncharacterized protein LOC117337658 isoform X1 [Pecten maximus]